MCIKNIGVQHSLDKNETATMFFLKKPFLVIFCTNIRAFTNLKFYTVKVFLRKKHSCGFIVSKLGDTPRPAYPYDFGVLCTFFVPIVRLYAQQ